MNRDYLLAMLERAIKTAAQTALAMLGADAGGLGRSAAGLGDLDLRLIGSVVALATLASILTSLASIKLVPGTKGPAAFGPESVEHESP